jgi:hypothetical protein
MGGQSISQGDLNTILGAFDLGTLNSLDYRDYVGFGMRNSAVYRELFMSALANSSISEEGASIIVALATAVKNKRRILEAMKKFATESWYNPVRQFFINKTCQLTSEESHGLLSVVHIPSCVPFITAKVWARITAPANRNRTAFLSNLWAAQINLDDELMAAQMDWEKHFWDEVVTKGGNNYKKGFQEEFWLTKAADVYPLIDSEGRIVTPTNGKYTAADVDNWLATF